MDRLPQEHILPEPPSVADMEVGDIRWIMSAKADPDGGMWIQKSSETKEKPHRGPVGPRYQFRVERLEEGWKVSIPKSHLPLEARWPAEMLSTIGFAVTEIEIVDEEGVSS